MSMLFNPLSLKSSTYRARKTKYWGCLSR